MIFIYPNDLCITFRYTTFLEEEGTTQMVLRKLTKYCRIIMLRTIPEKTQVSAFHLRKGDEKVVWNEIYLDN